MNRRSQDDLSLRTLLHRSEQLSASARSSFDYSSLCRQECRVTIFDQHDDTQALEPEYEELYVARFRIPQGQLDSSLPADLKHRLDNRQAHRTRWINVEGWSPGLADDLTNRFLENHGCLDLEDLGSQTLGGPIHRKDGSYFVWLQTSIWYAGQEALYWSSMQQCRVRMVVCLPTQDEAGTVITNFLGRPRFAEMVSNAFTQELLENHSMGSDALTCVWALAFSILRLTAQQLNLAWRIFDPLERTRTNKWDANDLSYFLESVNDLARIDRYISGLDEVAAFFDAVRKFQQSQSLSGKIEEVQPNLTIISARSELESALAQDRIRHARNICRTYIQQYDSQVSLMLSSNTTRIIKKLDSGQKLGDRLASVGVVLATMTFISTPFVMVTGYYGMNVQELVDGGLIPLFDFWQAVLPVLAVCIGLMIVAALRLITKHKRDSFAVADDNFK